MTSISVMEPLDETMLEYPGDADIAMYSGTSASGFWLSQEAVMDDDSNTVTLDSNSNRSETIEVDMEPRDHDEEMTEYEMADGDLVHPVDDIADIEVIDSSPSGTTVVASAESAVDAVAASHLMPVEVGPHPSSDAFPLAAPEEHGEQHIEHFFAMRATFSEVAPEETSSSNLVTVPQHTEEPTPIEAASTHVGDEINPSEFVPSVVDTQPGPEVHPPSELFENPEATESAALERFSPAPPPDGQTDDFAGQSLDVTDVSVEPSSEVTGEGAEISDSAEAVQKAEGEEDEYHGSFAEHVKNPLEISDGVYIDPPPAVLLSLSLSTEESDRYLFNQPIPHAYAQSSEAEETASSELGLLLHDQPTMYYESLNKVFVALREEASVSSAPEIAEGELVLDAYDLQLVISEDNIHAPDVTIHELNVLHDASGLQGPLRLRLYALTPRFISRYYALRDQLVRLNVDVEENHTEPLDETGHPDSNHVYESQEDHLEEGEDTNDDAETGRVEDHRELHASAPEAEDDSEELPRNDHTYDDTYQPDGDDHEQFHGDAEPGSSEDHTVHENTAHAVIDSTDPLVSVRPTHAETDQAAVEDTTAVEPHSNAGHAEDDQQPAQWGVYAQDDGTITGDETQEHPSDEYGQHDDAAENHDAQYELSLHGEETGVDVDSTALEHATLEEFPDDGADLDADGEYEDDTSYFTNEDGDVQTLAGHDVDDDDLHNSSTAALVAEAGAEAAGKDTQDTIPEAYDQHDGTTGEENYFQQELLEFDDEVEEVEIETPHKSDLAFAVTSGTSSKRTYDQVEVEAEQAFPPSSPEPKRLRAV